MKTKSRFPNSTTWVTAFLAVLLGAVLLTACATKQKPSRTEVAGAALDDLKAKAREVVKDETRAARFIALLEDSQALVASQSEALATHDQRIRALVANYETSEADLRSEFATFNAFRTERARRAVELAEQMRAATTPEEWVELHKVKKKAVSAAASAAK